MALSDNDGLCQHCKDVYRNNPDIEKQENGKVIQKISRFSQIIRRDK